MAKKPKRMRAYRLQEQIIAKIEFLAERWECTHAEVIERTIEGMREAGYTISPELPPRRADDVYNQPSTALRSVKRGPRPKGDKTR